MAPHILDVVFKSHDHAEFGLFVSPSLQKNALATRGLEAAVVQGTRNLRSERGRTGPTRALRQAEPSVIESAEMTHKGYINKRAVVARCATEVAAIYLVGNIRVFGRGDEKKRYAIWRCLYPRRTAVVISLLGSVTDVSGLALAVPATWVTLGHNQGRFNTRFNLTHSCVLVKLSTTCRQQVEVVNITKDL